MDVIMLVGLIHGYFFCTFKRSVDNRNNTENDQPYPVISIVRGSAVLCMRRLYAAYIIRAEAPSLSCRFCYMNKRLNDTSAGKKSREIHTSPKVAKHNLA